MQLHFSSLGPQASPLFAGREYELQELSSFAKVATDSDNLHLLWIRGEAGIGKSALISQAIDRLKEEQYVVLHVQCYPETANPITALTAGVLNSDPQLRRLVHQEIKADLHSILRAMRKIIRLRPTIFIVEDVHLLQDSEAVVLHNLVESLRNESSGIVCTARPDSSVVYQLMKEYLTHSIEMTGLDKEDIESLLKQIKIPVNDNLLHDLLQATGGVPFTIRSIIPKLIQIIQATPSIELDSLGQIIRQEASDMASGYMLSYTAGLTQEHREAACILAVLGEVFSPSAATILLGNKEILGVLEEQGIIHHISSFQPPLYGNPENEPLYAFSHSLLHQQLLLHAPDSSYQLLNVFESQQAVYSHTAIQHLATVKPEFRDGAHFLQAFKNLTGINRLVTIYAQSSTLLMELIKKDLNAIYTTYSPILSGDQDLIAQLHLLEFHIRILEHLSLNKDLVECSRAYLEKTEQHSTEEIARHRLKAISTSILLHARHGRKQIMVRSNDNMPLEQYFNEVERIRHNFPHVITTYEFIICIGSLASHATKHGPTSVNRVLPLFEEVLSDSNFRRITHTIALDKACMMLLSKLVSTLTTTEDERKYTAYKRRLTDLLKSTAGPLDDFAEHLSEIIKHRITSPLRGLSALIESHAIVTPHSRNYVIWRSNYLCMLSAIGIPRTELKPRVDGFINILEKRSTQMKATGVLIEDAAFAFMLFTSGILVDQLDWMREVAARIVKNDTSLLAGVMVFIQTLLYNDIEHLAQQYRRKALPVQAVSDFYHCLECCAGTEPNQEEIIRELKGLIHYRPGSVNAVLDIRAAITLAEGIAPRMTTINLIEALRESFSEALTAALEWCLQAGAAGYATPLIKMAHRYLNTSDYNHWVSKFSQAEGYSELLAQYDELVDEHLDASVPLLQISATIQVTDPEGSEKRFQGARVQRTAALIAANQLMHSPLNLSQFREIATGMSSDSPRIGNYTRTLLWRLRSVLGSESIITDGTEPPRFNTDLVKVDLFEASHHLQICDEALRKDQPRKAKEAVLEALNILGEGPVYPSLYDEFFEAARIDFELRLRERVLSTVALLRNSGDLEGTIPVLQRAQISMQGDDELEEELISVLQLSGRNTEAIKLRQSIAR